jgi:hypothetical protein
MAKVRALRLLEAAGDITGRAPTTRVASPMADRRLNRPVIEAVFGTGEAPLSRADAMTIPPVVKARSVLVSQIAPAPLVVLEGAERKDDLGNWLQQTDGAISPWHRMAWTIDDLLFVGWSVWAVERDADGTITRGERVPVELWEFQADGTLLIDGAGVDEESVIIFAGPSEGFLEYAQRSLRGARIIEEQWVKRSKNPVPIVELHMLDESRAMDDQEVIDLVADYMDARNDVNGTVATTPSWVELKVHGEQAPQLAIEARNYVKVDVANFTGLPASALDGSVSQASLTYSTQEGSRNEIADYTLSYWSDPIAFRLSQDDVTPSGTRVRFDFGNLRTTTPVATGPIAKD